MPTNIERFRNDLGRLILTGDELFIALRLECYPDEAKELGKKSRKTSDFLKDLPNFKDTYQRWYSEALVFLRQLLPDRVLDFVRHYEKPKPRKEITYENYRIEDCLQGLVVTRGWDKAKIVGPDAAIPHMAQQIAILKASEARFESSLSLRFVSLFKLTYSTMN